MCNPSGMHKYTEFKDWYKKILKNNISSLYLQSFVLITCCKTKIKEQEAKIEEEESVF
jgi:hypothetical protein